MRLVFIFIEEGYLERPGIDQGPLKRSMLVDRHPKVSIYSHRLIGIGWRNELTWGIPLPAIGICSQHKFGEE